MSVSELLNALQTALQTGQEEDLQHALEQGTDANFKALRSLMFTEWDSFEELWGYVELFTAAKEALVVAKLLVHTPSLVDDPETKEVLERLEKLQEFVEELEKINAEDEYQDEKDTTDEEGEDEKGTAGPSTQTIDNFLRASGYGQEQRWNQRLSLGLH